MLFKAKLGKPPVMRHLDATCDPGNPADDVFDGDFSFARIEAFGASVVQQLFVSLGNSDLVAQMGVVEPFFWQAVEDGQLVARAEEVQNIDNDADVIDVLSQ